MLLNSVIVVLREVLEAALLFSILFAFAKRYFISIKWFSFALGLGTIGAVIFALNMTNISDWFDGVGQEIVDAFLQYIIYFLLILYFFFQTKVVQKNRYLKVIILLMTGIMTLAITREGSEIILYGLSAAHSSEHYFAVITGMIIGAGIGVSIGFIFYYLLLLNYRWSQKIGSALLILVSAGMVSQATLLLIQADWLPAQMPLWNTSNILSERSITGQLLYALLGYEATPTSIQVVSYIISLMIPLAVIFFCSKADRLQDDS